MNAEIKQYRTLNAKKDIELKEVKNEMNKLNGKLAQLKTQVNDTEKF